MKKDKKVKAKEKKQPRFKVWYDSNKAEYNLKRRLRYKKDKAYREAQLSSTQKWRETVRGTRAKAAAPLRLDYSVAETAAEVGCSVETIRNLEEQGLIPRVTPAGSRAHRRYTEYQVQLIAELSEFRKNTHYRTTAYASQLKTLVGKIKKLWR